MTKSQQVTKTLLEFYQKPVAQVSLELFLSIAAVIFFTIFAIQPTLVTMSDLIKELEDKREIDQKLSQKIAALSTAQTTYLQIQDKIPLLYEAIPPRPQIKESLFQIEKIASDRSLVIENLSIRQIPAEVDANIALANTKTTTLPVTITMAGSYPNISAFIEDLISLRRMYIVESIVFSRTEERGNESLRASITLGLPFYRSSKEDVKERTAPTPAVLQDDEL
jgi:Tfp pilus assembly protein PilO